jgi:uncharacterized protein YegL
VRLRPRAGSMQGALIDQLNMGLRSFKDELVSDSLAAKRVEVAVLTFGDQVRLVSDFTDAATFEPPVLTAGGLTPMRRRRIRYHRFRRCGQRGPRRARRTSGV